MESSRKLQALSCVVNHTIGPTVAELQAEIARLNAELTAIKAAARWNPPEEPIPNPEKYFWTVHSPLDCFMLLGQDDEDYVDVPDDDGENKNPDYPGNWETAKADYDVRYDIGNFIDDRLREWFDENYPHRDAYP